MTDQINQLKQMAQQANQQKPTATPTTPPPATAKPIQANQPTIDQENRSAEPINTPKPKGYIEKVISKMNPFKKADQILPTDPIKESDQTQTQQATDQPNQPTMDQEPPQNADFLTESSTTPTPSPEIDRPEFYQRISFMFDAAAGMSPIFTKKKTGKAIMLSSIAIQPEEEAIARKMSDSIYDLAVKYPKILGWALKEGEGTLQAAFLIYSFASGKAELVKAEYRAKVSAMQETNKPDQGATE